MSICTSLGGRKISPDFDFFKTTPFINRSQSQNAMLKLLLPIAFITVIVVVLVLCLNRWRPLETLFPRKALQVLCIGCVIAGALALFLF